MKEILYALLVLFGIGLGIAFAWVACFAPEWMYVIVGITIPLSVLLLKED